MKITMNPRISLNGRWHFQIDPQDIGLRDQWYLDAAISASWKTIDVPGAFEQHGIDGDEHVGWYRRTFNRSQLGDVNCPFLTLSGIEGSARVWLNDTDLINDLAQCARYTVDVSPYLRDGENVLTVRVRDHGAPGGIMTGAWIADADRFVDPFDGEYVKLRARPSVDWVRDAVVYEVYLRSFSPEGTFAGLEKRLDELKALGVTVVWLMPIHPIGKLKRKGTLGSPYAIRDYYGINPEFGTLDDFRRLLDAAHARGLRLIIDLVANHTSWDNALIEEHPEWYRRDEHGRPVSPMDWTDVAQLDYADEELRRYMIEMMLYWVRDVGIDGFRCDVAGMVPNDFWIEARPKLDAVKEVIMIAEDDNPLQHAGPFDITYDWWTYQAMGRLAAGRLNPWAIQTILVNERLDFPAGSLRMRFSDNHDLCAWHKPGMTRYGPAAARAAAVLTFALPGVPLIYNGQEIGNRTPLPLFEKLPICWSSDNGGIRELFTRLCRLRAENTAFRRGKLDYFLGYPPSGVLCFGRATGKNRLIVAVNCSNQSQHLEWKRIRVDRPRPLLADPNVPDGDVAGITLPPLGYWIGQLG